MEFFEVIKKRFSCRNFLPKPVEQEKVAKLLKAATLAPSAGNTQDWRFCVVRDKKLKELLAQASKGQSFIKEAPVVIVVCSDLEEIEAHYGERGRKMYAFQDTAAAIENLLLSATALGLGSCWVGAFDEKEITGALGLLPSLKPVALIPIGYPAEKAKPRLRKSLKEVIVLNK